MVFAGITVFFGDSFFQKSMTFIESLPESATTIRPSLVSLMVLIYMILGTLAEGDSSCGRINDPPSATMIVLLIISHLACTFSPGVLSRAVGLSNDHQPLASSDVIAVSRTRSGPSS